MKLCRTIPVGKSGFLYLNWTGGVIEFLYEEKSFADSVGGGCFD